MGIPGLCAVGIVCPRGLIFRHPHIRPIIDAKSAITSPANAIATALTLPLTSDSRTIRAVPMSDAAVPIAPPSARADRIPHTFKSQGPVTAPNNLAMTVRAAANDTWPPSSCTTLVDIGVVADLGMSVVISQAGACHRYPRIPEPSYLLCFRGQCHLIGAVPPVVGYCVWRYSGTAKATVAGPKTMVSGVVF